MTKDHSPEPTASRPSSSSLVPPTIRDVFDARKAIAPYLRPTPLHCYRSLCDVVGFEVLVKHENHQPTGAFKIRGGINLMSRLGPDDRRRGVISASTGNHGQSIAYAGRLFDVAVVIVVPQDANPSKVDAMRALGADVRFHGHDFDEAREHVEMLSASEGYRYIHSANEALLIAGVATAALEILEAAPDLDVVFVPIGAGSGAAGCGLVMKTLAPRVRVIGVCAEKAPAVYLSWKEGRPVEAAMETFAEGAATRVSFELTQRMLRDFLDDFMTVSEDELAHAIMILLEKTHNLAEGAGALALAAALRQREELKQKKVAIILSGGNLSMEQLRWVLSREAKR